MASPEIEALTQALARLPGLGPALGAARGAAPDQEARDRADAAAARARAGEREAFGLLDLRQCRHHRSLRRSAPIRAATRACSAWSRRWPTSGRSIARGFSRAASTCSAAGFRRSKGCGPRISASTAGRRVAAGGIDEVVLAMNATLEGQTTAHYLAERLETLPGAHHPARPWPAGRRRARLSRRGHAGPGAAGAPAGPDSCMPP